MADNIALSTLKQILLLFLLAFTFVKPQISDKRLCADKQCKVVISKAKALGRHPGDHPLKLTFGLDDIISVTSKSAGKNPHLWGGEFNGHKGYFDKNFVKEMKVFVENPIHEVETEGEIFEKLRPPIIDSHHNRHHLKHKSLVADASNEMKKEKAKIVHLVAPSSGGSDVKDSDIGDRSKQADDTGKNDIIDDLLKNNIPEDALKKDQTGDLGPEKKESSDDNHNDEDSEIDPELDSWDIVDDEFDDDEYDYYEPKRERFDTADLNDFLKKKFFPGGKTEADNVDSDHHSEEDTLKVKPEIQREDNDQRNMEGRGHHKHEQSSKSEDLHTMDVIHTKIPSEIIEKDSNNLTKNDEEVMDGKNRNDKYVDTNEGDKVNDKENTGKGDQVNNKENSDKGDQVNNKENTGKGDQESSNDDTDVGDQEINKDDTDVGDQEINTDNTEVGDQESSKNDTDVGDQEINKDDTDVGDQEINKDNTDPGDQESGKDDTDVGDQESNKDNTDVGDQEINKDNTDVGDQESSKDDTDVGDQEINKDDTDQDIKQQLDISELNEDEHFAVDDSDFDPTEIDESSPNEFEEGTHNFANNKDSEEKVDKSTNEDSEKKVESNINMDETTPTKEKYVENKDLETNNHSDDEESIGRIKEHNQKTKDLSKEEIKEDSKIETSGSNKLKKILDENSTHNIGKKTSSEEKLKEKSSLETDKSNDVEKTPEKTDQDSREVNKIEKGNENKGKSFATENKQDADETSLADKEVNDKINKKKSGNPEMITSEVRPDTPSDTLSPESGQGVDPITEEKVKLDDASLPHKEFDAERKDKLPGLESVSSSYPGDQSSDTSSILSGKELQVDSTDKDIPSGGGFVSFLQSSRTETEQSDLATETPKLNTNSASAFIDDKDSNSAPSKLHIESSKTDEYKQDVTGDDDEGDKKINGVKGLETFVEDGSTIVLDGNGNLVTAFMLDDKVTQETNDMQSSFLPEKASTLSIQQVKPTAVDILPKPSELNKKDTETRLQGKENNIHLNNTHSKIIHSDDNSLLDNQFVSEAYQSSDFISRNLLSVNQPPATSQQQQQSPPTSQQQQQIPPTSQQQPSEERKQQEPVSVISTPALSLPLTLESSSEAEMISELPDVLAKSQTTEASATTDSTPLTNQSSAGGSEEQIKQTVPEQGDQSDEPEKVKADSATTQSTIDSLDIPLPPADTGESQSDLNDASIPSGDYEADSVYHSRKITDEDLINEEEQKSAEPSQGFFKRIIINLERHTRDLFEMLPTSVQSALEPFSLVPNMKVLVVTFSLAMLISTSFISCCFSGGSSKKQQRDMLVKFDEMEKRRLIDLKEKQNLEDEIENKSAKNKQMKDEIAKLTEESKKNKSELHTVNTHNETMKKQLSTFQGKIDELKENATSKQGEVKQQSKKTKDLEKQIKKLEEREGNLEQTVQKLTSDLKHKDEEVTLLTSRVTGLIDQVGHLQTSKDQLLAEAEDWREKVSDLKERLEQREEEFKQMQEIIMFKENELEVLKDCFLQLKSFEDNEEEGENTEDASVRVKEKISSMMDVSKMNASLLALEEDKNSLANKLEIEMEARRELEEQLESSRRGVESSMADKMKAERQCQEALTKLNVLSTYFKEKETQLQRELGEQEALKKQNQNKLVSADETTKTVQQELEFVRTQNESLKRELASSERDFRSQIAANEKKAHENWLAARAAERELKEVRHDAGVLRQKLTDIERRQFVGPGGLIRPLPTRGMPPAGVMNGPPPPGMDRSPSRGSLPILPPPHLRDDDFLAASRGDRGPPPFPLDPRRAPGPPPGMYPLPPDARSPPPRVPPFSGGRSPPLRMPPPGMMDGRSPPPYDRRPPPPHMLDRRNPPFHHPSDMLPPPLRGMPLPPPHLSHRSSPPLGPGPDSPRLDGRYPLPPYGRNHPPPSDRPSPKQSNQTSPRQQQSQV